MDVQETHKIVRINSLQSEQEQSHAGTDWRSGGCLPVDSELTQRDIHWAMIFLAVIALAMVAQAIGVLVSAAFGAKLLHRVNVIADIVETKTGPIMDRTASILQDLEPKVKSVGESAEHITSTVRVKVDELGVTMTELNADDARHQWTYAGAGAARG